MRFEGEPTSPLRDLFQRPSAVALLIANVIPLIGVLALGWEVFPLVLLFWFENVILGVITVLKMLLARNGNGGGAAAKLFMIPFFTFHYGIFTLVHGIFVMAIFGAGLRIGVSPGDMLSGPASVWNTLTNNHLHWAAAGLAISHLASFYFDYVRTGAYDGANLGTLMISPYGRIVVLHMAILIGGALVMWLGSPTIGLLLLVVLKTAFDWHSLKQTRAREQAPCPIQ